MLRVNAMLLCRVVFGVLFITQMACDVYGEKGGATSFRLMTFNILQGGGNAANAGFPNSKFGGSRYDDLVKVIRFAKADIVCVQERDASGQLLSTLGEGWQQAGKIYTRYKIKGIATTRRLDVCEVRLPNGRDVVVINVHWRPSEYGPDQLMRWMKKGTLPGDQEVLEKKILKFSDKSKGQRGYNETLRALRPFMKRKEPVVLAGDFNEPSHLDWTKRAALKGMDRWVKNPTKTALRFKVPWLGSRLLHEAGLRDAYRVVHPDEVKKPGTTWTPRYTDTKGRRAYGDQSLDRIDMIYYTPDQFEPEGAWVVGGEKKYSDLVYEGRWPSDHRGVVVKFELKALKR